MGNSSALSQPLDEWSEVRIGTTCHIHYLIDYSSQSVGRHRQRTKEQKTGRNRQGGRAGGTDEHRERQLKLNAEATQRDRQTDRQIADRQTDRERERETETQRDRTGESERERERDR